jgi:fructuronate reductase
MDGGDRNWSILGVSLRSAAVADQLNPQGGLYSLTECSGEGQATRLVGSVQRVLIADKESKAVVEALAAPETRIASFTITEKGYCRSADGSLDPALAHEGSVYAFLARGLEQRRALGLPGLTLLSCDNLQDNGGQLERLFAQYLELNAPLLLRWVTAECTFPSTMVDRIVPAPTTAQRDELAARIGMTDEGAIFSEPFSQWVIEDDFAGSRPRWDDVGVQFTTDVASYETAKLRMLNGAHSALAYLGLQRGYRTVHQAMDDVDVRALVERLMRDEAAPSIKVGPTQDLASYAQDLLIRFRNPALDHSLSQIAMDGSQKIPQRWLATLAWNQAQGRQCPAILAALAAWLRHTRGDNGVVDDPRAGDLAQAWAQAGEDGIVDMLFGPGRIIGGEWRATPTDRAMVMAGLHS